MGFPSTPTIFSESHTQAIVDALLPEPGTLGEKALVATVTEHGASVMAVFKFTREQWELQGAAGVAHEFAGETSGVGRVVLRWK